MKSHEIELDLFNTEYFNEPIYDSFLIDTNLITDVNTNVFNNIYEKLVRARKE